MRNTLTTFFLLAFGICQGGETIEPKEVFTEEPNKGWYFGMEAVLMKVDRLDGHPLFQTRPDNADPNFLFSSDDELGGEQPYTQDYRPGVKIYAGYELNDVKTLELSYTGLLRWEQNHTFNFSDIASLSGDPDFFPTVGTNGVPGVDAWDRTDGARIRTDTKLHDVEVNLREERREGLTGVAGARILYLSDDISVFAIDDSSVFSPGPTADLGEYAIDSDNILLGVQIGLEYEEELNSALSFFGSLSAGAYANFASIESTFTDFDLGPTGQGDNAGALAGEDDEVSAAFTGSVKVGVIWKMKEGVRFNAGYQASLIHGLALGDENLDNDSTDPLNDPNFLNSIDTDGRLLFHGGSIGFEIDLD